MNTILNLAHTLIIRGSQLLCWTLLIIRGIVINNWLSFYSRLWLWAATC